MRPYLSHAFWLRVSTPALGAMPLNALLFAGLLILGLAEFIRFNHAGFWLLAIGLEVSYLFIVARHPAFQAKIDQQERQARNIWEQQQIQAKRQLLIKRLNSHNKKRFQSLDHKIKRIKALETENNIEQYLSDTNYQALQKLLWMYLKLLTAEENLQNPELRQQVNDVRQQVQQLIHDLKDNSLTAITQDSMQATIKLLQKRLHNGERREQTLKRVQSDLTHIKAQIDLALENATIDGQAQITTDKIEMVSQFLQEMQDEFYGKSQQDIADLDQLFK